jgi:hypothetical protein
VAGGRFAQAAAGASDDDDFSCDMLVHVEASGKCVDVSMEASMKD